MDEVSYLIVEQGSRPSIVLADYLTSLPPGLIQAYVSCYTKPGDVVLDPFCQNDAVATEALRMGRKAILTDFNPITTFVARASFSNLTSQQLSYAFVRLSEGARMQTSLRAHINQLYMTTCSRCHRQAVVSYFVWNRDEDRPVRKHYLCDACRPGNGTYQMYSDAVDDADLERACQIEPKGFHYSYVVDRLAAEATGQEILAKQLLQLYTPRNLYALVTILMQIEAVFDNPHHQDVLKLALLDCLDSCSKLNAVAKNARPWNYGKDLRPPARFVERNVWEAFDGAFKRINERIERRRTEGQAARFASTAEQLLSMGGQAQQETLPNLVVRKRSARSLTDEIPEGSVDLVIAAPPFPDRSAFLALSYLWSGWLFGPEQAATFNGLGKLRHKVDWEPYFKGMLASFKAIGHALKRDCLLVLDFDSPYHEQCEAIVFAGIAAGFQVKRIIYQPLANAENEPAKLLGSAFGHYCIQMVKLPHYVAAQRPRAAAMSSVGAGGVADTQLLEKCLKSSVKQAIRDILTQRAEPLSFDWLVVAVYERLGKDMLCAEAMRTGSVEAGLFDSLRRLVDGEIKAVLEKDYRQLPLEPGKGAFWWFARRSFSATPISEQVEEAVYNVLSTSPSTNEQSLAHVVYSLFPGLLTPEQGWMEQILQSYGVKEPGMGWLLRPEDGLQKRRQQHSEIIAALVHLGHRLGYKVGIGKDQEKQLLDGRPLKDLLHPAERSFGAATLLGGTRGALIDVIWYDHAMPLHIFEVEWTATLSEAVFARRVSSADARRYLVVPEERVGLIQFKLEKLSWFHWAIESEGWDFIKFHHLLKLVQGEEELSLFGLRKIVGLHPVVECETAQLRLL